MVTAVIVAITCGMIVFVFVFVIVDVVRSAEALPEPVMSKLCVERSKRLMAAADAWARSVSGTKCRDLGFSITLASVAMFVVLWPLPWGMSDGPLRGGFMLILVLLAGLSAFLAVIVGNLVARRSLGTALMVAIVWLASIPLLLVGVSAFSGASTLTRGVVVAIASIVCVGVFLGQVFATRLLRAHPRLVPVRAFVAASLRKEADEPKPRERRAVGRWYAAHSGVAAREDSQACARRQRELEAERGWSARSHRLSSMAGRSTSSVSKHMEDVRDPGTKVSAPP